MNEYIFNYKQYKNNLNTKKNFHFVAIFLVIILLLSIIVLLKQQSNQKNKFYFIEIDRFATYKNAQNFIQKTSNQDKKIYIYFDNVYHLFISFHFNKTKAKSEVENLKKIYENVKIFSLEIPSFSASKNLTNSENKIIKSFNSKTHTFILKASTCFSNFCSAKCSFEELKFHLENLHDDLNNSCEKVIRILKLSNKYHLLQKYSNNIKTSIDNSINFTEENLTTNFNYELIDLIINYHHFFSCF